MINLLLQKFPNEKKSLQELGPLERYQLRYLFENEVKLLKLIKNENIDIKLNYFFLSFGLINTLTREEIKILNQRLEEYKNFEEKKPSLFIIVLGILNHWVINSHLFLLKYFIFIVIYNYRKKRFKI